MKITIQTIPHSSQVYETVGNYETHEGITEISVSDMGNEDYEFLVALHELIEWKLTQKRGIGEKTITDFDIDFEKTNKESLEPGDDISSPYRKEHFFATTIERLMASELGIDWEEYDKGIMYL